MRLWEKMYWNSTKQLSIALVAWPGTDGLDASDPADAQAQPSPSFLCPEMINREYGLGLKYA